MGYKRYIVKEKKEEPPSGFELCITLVACALAIGVLCLVMPSGEVIGDVVDGALIAYALDNPHQALFTYNLINRMK